ncbi:hypothetical protein [Bartonella pachyuromydis]|uniref:Uncharacterized protein n=1 Tax=Bartonella pachyuromydis TaxID=931097 RepID=A0ABP8VNP8_9HYPH
MANVAHILHKCKGAIYRITYSRKKVGAGGLFPSSYQVQLLSYAKRHDIDLCAEDFFYPERLQNLMNKEQSPPPPSFVNGFSLSEKSCQQNKMVQPQYEERE